MKDNGSEPLCKCLALPTSTNLEMVVLLSLSPHRCVLEQGSVNYVPSLNPA